MLHLGYYGESVDHQGRHNPIYQIGSANQITTLIELITKEADFATEGVKT